MPVTLSYPGIYIEELPSSAHTITAAPTSITVFIGYTHPYKTRTPREPVRIFSFSDYEREFGGLYSSKVFDNKVAHAVNQFFLNGGSDAYVVGLQQTLVDASNTVLTYQPKRTFAADGATGIVFRALEPTDGTPMEVRIDNLRSGDVLADITITYGRRVETYRDVTLDQSPAQNANFIETRINGASGPVPDRPLSSLVTVQPTAGGYPAKFKQEKERIEHQDVNQVANSFDPADFHAVFQADGDLDKVPIFNLMTLPGVADNGILSDALAFCERKLAFLIMDPPQQAAADTRSAPLPPIVPDTDDPNSIIEKIPKSPNGALYFPYLFSQDPITGDPIELPPSGYVAGMYAKTDANFGVWKAPAGYETTLLNTTGVVDRGRMTDQRQGVLNLKAVNCLRDFPGVGTVIFGARTLVGSRENTAQQQNRYVPVRRMTLFIEQTLRLNLTWVIFRPNDEPLWVAIRTSIENFMLGLFRQGALQGRTPSQAFQVKCDADTTTPDDVENGIVNIVVAFAPLKPAEFVVIKIAQLTGQAQS